MKHSFSIDSQKEQRPQRMHLSETVLLFVRKVPVVIVTLLLLIGLSLVFVGSTNVAHAAVPSLTQQGTNITGSNIGAQPVSDGYHGHHHHGHHHHGHHHHGHHHHGHHNYH